MSKETVGTIGDQKSIMPCANMTEAEFVKEVTDGLLPPSLFRNECKKAELKVLKRFSINGKLSRLPIEVVAEETGAILDTEIMAILQGFIPQSIKHVDGDFGWVLIGDVKQPILLVTDLGLKKKQ
jgi:hypothetical protein